MATLAILVHACWVLTKAFEAPKPADRKASEAPKPAPDPVNDDGTPALYLPKLVTGIKVLLPMYEDGISFKVLPGSGVAFRLSKNLSDKDGDRGLDQSQIIQGLDDGEWVRVDKVYLGKELLGIKEYLAAGAHRYLPKSVNGVKALEVVDGVGFKVLPSKGMAFRLSKKLEDKDGDRGLDKNQVFHGFDDGEWIRVDRVRVGKELQSIKQYLDGAELFLPKKVGDVQVLEQLEDGVSFKVLPPAGVAFRKSKNLEDKDGERGLDQNIIFHGLDDGEWVRVDRIRLGKELLDIDKHLKREEL